jgi:acid phosphatase
MEAGTMQRPVPFFAVLVLAIALALAGCAGPGKTTPSAETVAGAGSATSLRTLYANAYVQASAEYRACCHGIYASAAIRLREILEGLEPDPRPPAVLMDLDETVLDNSRFQTFLYVNGLTFTDELWDAFERGGVQEVGLVPGARAFIEEAESLGVTVVYLSNRNERNLRWTAQAVGHAGLNAESIEKRLYLKPEGGSSDKTARRDAVSERYNVLMYFGDNLRDFSEVFASPRLPAGATADDRRDAISERAAAADDAVGRWGIDWFVLPNPVYGEWEKLIGEPPHAILRPTDFRGTPAKD